MKLTHRQETFLLRLLDLYNELDGPIHYSTLAERVGVSPFTAYDMLRLLEEKGVVKSEYRITPGKTPVGRAEVVFLPTPLAAHRFSELANGADFNDWESVKSQILARIQSGAVCDPAFAAELLARIPPDAPDSLRYCIEVMTLLILRVGKGNGRRILEERLPQIREWKDSFSKSGLIILGGFVLGLLAMDNTLVFDRDQSILEHIQRYQSLVMDMEPRLIRRLAESINETFSLVLNA